MAIESVRHIRFEQGITLPITTEFQQIAQRFAQQCPFSEKAAQIKQNTLAVCAVNAYLQLTDISTCLADSDSWNPIMQMMADVADLKVPNVGAFSCRAIAPTDTTCYIPPEDWHNRAGYIAVVIDEAASQATLLGFISAVNEVEQVPLESFAPIETLIDRVHSLQASAIASPPITDLSQRIQSSLLNGWQAAAELINPPELEFAFRASESSSHTADPTTDHTADPTADISRAKLVDLGLQLGHSLQVALVIHLAPTSNHRSDIVLQIRPLGDANCLPAGITLSIFDASNTLFRSATSRAIDNYIQLQVTGESGEIFSIQVSKNEVVFTEKFVI
ncbi:MAG: DUF1822 family protein [Phormidesmis sp.]